LSSIPMRLVKSLKRREVSRIDFWSSWCCLWVLRCCS